MCCGSYFLTLVLIFITHLNLLFAEESSFKSFIFILHEDGDYSYFDGNKKKNSPAVALEQIDDFARQKCRIECEVFIFRQKKLERLSSSIPRYSQSAYYFLNGKQIEHKSYLRENFAMDWELEGGFVQKFSRLNQQEKSLDNPHNAMRLLYFQGKAIPEFSEIVGYHSSMPEESFGLSEVVKGVERFGIKGDDDQVVKNFDAMVFVTPYLGIKFVHALSSKTKYLMTSPAYLHAIGLEWSVLNERGDQLNHENLNEFLIHWQGVAFDYLKRKTNTPVNIVLYDMEQMKKNFFSSESVIAMDHYYKNVGSRAFPTNNIDCGEVGLVQLLNSSERAKQGIYLVADDGAEEDQNFSWYRKIPSGLSCPNIPDFSFID